MDFFHMMDKIQIYFIVLLTLNSNPFSNPVKIFLLSFRSLLNSTFSIK